MLERYDIQNLFNGIANTIRGLYNSYCKYDNINMQLFIDALKAVDKMELYLKGDFQTLWVIEAEEGRLSKSRYLALDLMEQGLLPSLPPSPRSEL
jgi:hypothetical protein